MACELNVDVIASKLSMYSKYSKNLEQRRQGDPTYGSLYHSERESMRDCVLVVLAKERGLLVACELRLLLNALSMV